MYIINVIFCKLKNELEDESRGRVGGSNKATCCIVNFIFLPIWMSWNRGPVDSLLQALLRQKILPNNLFSKSSGCMRDPTNKICFGGGRMIEP